MTKDDIDLLHEFKVHKSAENWERERALWAFKNDDVVKLFSKLIKSGEFAKAIGIPQSFFDGSIHRHGDKNI